MSRAACRACLRRFFGRYAPLEGRVPRLQAWRDAGLIHGDRRKTLRPGRGLAGRGVTPAALGQTPQCQALSGLRTTVRLSGCLRAIEAASPGSQIVTRHLQASPGVAPQACGAFLSGGADQTGSRRKAFRARLTALAGATGADKDNGTGANDGFQTLGRRPNPARPRSPEHDEPANTR